MKNKSKEEIFEEIRKFVMEARNESSNVIRKLGDYGIESEIKEDLKNVPSKLNWVLDLLHQYKNSQVIQCQK